jgi:hypothetical protein
MYNKTMFQSIKDALNSSKSEQNNSTYTEIIKTTPGNTYTVRLLPYTPNPADTFFHFYNHGWTSFATGQYVQALSPITFGERDPIAEERYKLLRTGTEEEKEKAGTIRRLEKYLVNVYVIDDTSNPDNNGKVKILRYGSQLHKIIMEAIEGEDAQEFGDRIFDLGPNGVNFKVKCEKQGDYPTYVSSRFTTSGKLNLSDSEQQKIYDSVFDLTKVFTLKSYDDLKKMVDEHLHCRINDSAPTVPVSQPRPQAPHHTETEVDNTQDDIDDINELLNNL